MRLLLVENLNIKLCAHFARPCGRGGIFFQIARAGRREPPVPVAAVHEFAHCTFETSRDVRSAVAIGGRADIDAFYLDDRFVAS
jgi:hypothetical protein